MAQFHENKQKKVLPFKQNAKPGKSRKLEKPMGGRISRPKPKPKPKPNLHRGPPRPQRPLRFGTSASEPVCYICQSASYEEEILTGEEPPPLIAQGCGCRDAGAAKMCHVPCAVKWLEAVPDLFETYDRFVRCGVCKQRFRGAFKMGVAKARWEHVKRESIDSEAKLLAAVVLAQGLTDDGKPASALTIMNAIYDKLRAHNSAAPYLVNILVAKAAALYMLGPARSQEHTDTLYLILNSGLPDSSREIMEANSQLSMALVRANTNLPMAETRARSAVDESKAMGPHHEQTQITYANNLATVLAKRQKFAEALSILKEISALALRVLGDDHDVSMSVMTNTAETIVKSRTGSRYEEAVENIRRTYEIRLARLGKDNQATIDSLQNLHGVLLHTGAKCPYPACQSLVSVLGSKVRCTRCKVAKYCREGCREADRARHTNSGICVRNARNQRG